MIEEVMRPKFHYAWVVAGVTFLSLLASAGMRSTVGVLIVPLKDEFGWSLSSITLAVSINLILFGLCGPFAAGLMERFGLRRVMVAALFTVALASAITTIMIAEWQLDLLWGVMVGLATGSMASVLAAVVANRWFVKNRGLVLGLLTASGATGQLVFLPLLAWLNDTLGWRAAAWTTAGAAVAVAVVVALLMRDYPRDLGLRPYGAEPGSEEAVKPLVNPVGAALGGLGRGVRNKNFWLLGGSFFICGLSTNGLIGTHLIPASMDHGIPEVAAAGLLAAIGVFDLIGTTVSGWLSDRFDNRFLLAWYYGLRGLSLLLLPYALGTTFLSLALFVVFYGLDWVATVPPTVRLTADTFGKENVGIMFGWIFAMHQFGAATASFGAGALHDLLGDYQVAFISAGLLCLVASGMVTRIGRSASKQTAEIAPRLPAEAAAS